MDPKSIIIAKRRGGKLEVLSDPNESIPATEEKFMPFRLNNSSADFEWAALCSLNVERIERFVTVAPEAPSSKKAKLK